MSDHERVVTQIAQAFDVPVELVARDDCCEPHRDLIEDYRAERRRELLLAGRWVAAGDGMQVRLS